MSLFQFIPEKDYLSINLTSESIHFFRNLFHIFWDTLYKSMIQELVIPIYN